MAVAAPLTAKDYLEIAKDPKPWRFFDLLQIEHRATKKFVPFNDLTPEQEDWVETLVDHQEAATLKSRNVGLGVSTQAFHFWKAWRAAMMGDAINTLCVAHAEDTAKRHLVRYKEFNDRLPAPIRLKEAVKNETDYKLIVPGTGENGSPPEYVWFRAVTADGKNGAGRGFTQQQVHFTEFAFYRDASGVLASVTSAMHKGKHYSVVIETTSAGLRGYYPTFVDEQRGAGADATFAFRFYEWFRNPTFRDPAPPNAAPLTGIEEGLRIRYKLDREQIQWRRNKLRGFTQEEFSQHYPSTVEEAFAKTGEAYFSTEVLMPQLQRIRERDRWEPKSKRPTGMREFFPPERGEVYAVALDPSGGVGEDHHAISVVSSRLEQVACYNDNTSTVSAVTQLAIEMAIRYNSAVLLIEGNSGYGQTAVAHAKEVGYPIFMGENGKPFCVWGSGDKGNKKEIFGWIKLQIEHHRVTVQDLTTCEQMIGMSRTGPNRDRTSARRGHDDLAVAFIYAMWAVRNEEPREERTPARRADDIVSRMKGRLTLSPDGMFRRTPTKSTGPGLYSPFSGKVH